MLGVLQTVLLKTLGVFHRNKELDWDLLCLHFKLWPRLSHSNKTNLEFRRLNTTESEWMALVGLKNTPEEVGWGGVRREGIGGAGFCIPEL